MEHNIRVIGKKTYRMVMVFRHGLMGQSMKDIINRDKNMGKVLTYGVMAQNILVYGKKIEFQDMVYILG